MLMRITMVNKHLRKRKQLRAVVAIGKHIAILSSEYQCYKTAFPVKIIQVCLSDRSPAFCTPKCWRIAVDYQAFVVQIDKRFLGDST
jgi:hypothetical protein